MSFLRHTLAAALTAAFFFPARAAEPAAAQYERLAAVVAAGRLPAGERIEVDVDPESLPALQAEADGEGLALRYPMAFNNVAEGWSWRPRADPAAEDYYRFKFLPLQSVMVEKGGYEGEDKIGTPQHMAVSWRYDYFLAFDNLYDFYPRSNDDDAGFAARTAARPAHVGLRAVAHLVEPCLSESTTFWKATYGRPVDFTLKKRYLVAVLDEIRFIDRDSGAVLAVVRPAGDPQR